MLDIAYTKKETGKLTKWITCDVTIAGAMHYLWKGLWKCFPPTTPSWPFHSWADRVYQIAGMGKKVGL